MQSDMDLQNAGNYRYYKCRSLLACDTGGTVYDTSVTYDSNYNNTNLPCSNQDQINNSSKSQNIIYIVENEYINKKELLVDSIACLQRNEFNNCEILTNGNNIENEVLQSVPVENKIVSLDLKSQNQIQTENFDYTIENDDSKEIQEMLDHILSNDKIFMSQESEYYPESSSSSNLTYYEDSDISKNYDSPDVNTIQEKHNIQYFLPSTWNKSNSLGLNSLNRQEINEYEYDPSIKTGIDVDRRHVNKRKQIYAVKNDSFTELLDVNKDVNNKEIVSSNKNKKKKLVQNKENQKNKSYYQKKNPFANLKMNSILKGSKIQSLKKSKNHCKLQSTTFSNDDNLDQYNNNPYNGEIKINERKYQNDYVSSQTRNDVLQEIDGVIKLNSEFTSADYLECVQPREMVIESDMDKLLTPSIEVEFSEIHNTHTSKQLIREKESQIDDNGNEIHFQDDKKINESKKILTPSEIAERQLFLKSAYAKKLGYENYFNISNDCIINEILFGNNLAYKETKLDTSFISNPEVCMKTNENSDNSFKPVSLLESINEFNRFGGFVEESNHVIELDDEESVSSSESKIKFQKDSINSSSVYKYKENKDDLINSHYSFNLPNKSNSFNSDFQSRFESVEYLSKADIEARRSTASLIIKIKRIDDESNKYIIDDTSPVHEQNINDKRITNIFLKNYDKYECFNCSERFRTKRILKAHVSENHKGPYDTECDFCHKKFKRSSAHKKHKSWCYKNVVYKCEFCSKEYCYQASLVKHLQAHRNPSNPIQL